MHSFTFNTTQLEQQFYHINDDLLVKYLLGEAGPEESRAVMQWLNADTANQHYFDQIKKIWDKSGELAVHAAVDEKAAWERFLQKTRNKVTAPDAVSPAGIPWMKMAASVVILLGIALSVYLLSNRPGQSPEVVTQTQGSTWTDTLPDGSVVVLNKHSSLKRTKSFSGKNRKVRLSGEAFFQVTPDKNRPFIIEAGDVQVEVLGTSFNVKQAAGRTEVLVETGLVKVTRAGVSTELRAGEKLLLGTDHGKALKTPVTDKLHSYYRSREFVCDNTPLWKLAEVLSEAYEVPVRIGREELKERRLNTTFYNESLDKILEVIRLTFDIRVRKDNGVIILE